MSWDLGMNYWYQLLAQTIGTCQMQLPGACSQHGWTTTKEPIGRRDHATDPGRPEGQRGPVSLVRPPAARKCAERRWSIGSRLSIARPC